MTIIITLLIAVLAAVVVGIVVRFLAPQYERAAAVIAFLVVLLVRFGAL